MKVLVGCEFSAVVREAFCARGHDAWSCDIQETEIPGQHIRCDLRELLGDSSWDLLIAFPPCTFLSNSGAQHNQFRRDKQAAALEFVRDILYCDIPKKCVENPIGAISRFIRDPSQIIQPWMFGHGEVKSTCLWLEGLPLLVPTDIVPGREAKIHRRGESELRARERSRTYSGIAAAMAAQWG